MRAIVTASLVLAAWLLGAAATAHQGGTDARGTVQAVGADRVALRTADGKVLELPITARTRCVRGGRTIAPSDIRVGERAVVHATQHEGKLEATEVRVSGAAR